MAADLTDPRVFSISDAKTLAQRRLDDLSLSRRERREWRKLLKEFEELEGMGVSDSLRRRERA